MTVESITMVATSLGLGSLLTICVNKFFSRKTDAVALTEMSATVYQKLISDLQSKLNLYIDMTEKSVRDIAVLQEKLREIYPLTCKNVNCPHRQLMESHKLSADVSINDGKDEN